MVTEHLRFPPLHQKQNTAASNSLDLGELILWQTENGENTFLVHKRTAHTSTEGSSDFAAVPNCEVGTQSCKKEFCLEWIEGCTVKDFLFFFSFAFWNRKWFTLKQKMVNFFFKWKFFCSGGKRSFPSSQHCWCTSRVLCPIPGSFVQEQIHENY